MAYLTSMPSTTSVLSTFTSFVAAAMFVRTVLNEVKTITCQFIPQKLQGYLISRFEALFGKFSDQLTLIIDHTEGSYRNTVYQAAELYLSTRITPSIHELKVSQAPREKCPSVTINKGQKVIDTFEGMQLTWEFVVREKQKASVDYKHATETTEHKSFILSFRKIYKEKVLNNYLPFVAERSKAIKESRKLVRLYALGTGRADTAINFEHPSTFDTLAMDPVVKQELIDDLDRFSRRREFYKRVGKAWKRGYLLYGPPGTGKSSLIAAMANHLQFDVYDIELASIRSNSELRRHLVSTGNRSILVIEDIDCSTELVNRQKEKNEQIDTNVTLSGLLNFVDGLWSSCVDERIIVFTTNYKERLDPALLRPGRMDKHIHMSYLTPSGFKIIAFNYLKIESHSLFDEIQELIKEVDVTPAAVAEELMKSEDAEVALNGLADFLRRKKEQNKKCEEVKVEDGKEGDEGENGSQKFGEEG